MLLKFFWIERCLEHCLISMMCQTSNHSVHMQRILVEYGRCTKKRQSWSQSQRFSMILYRQCFPIVVNCELPAQQKLCQFSSHQYLLLDPKNIVKGTRGKWNNLNFTITPNSWFLLTRVYVMSGYEQV